jgi:hypothetical protein
VKLLALAFLILASTITFIAFAMIGLLYLLGLGWRWLVKAALRAL